MAAFEGNSSQHCCYESSGNVGLQTFLFNNNNKTIAFRLEIYSKFLEIITIYDFLKIVKSDDNVTVPFSGYFTRQVDGLTTSLALHETELIPDIECNVASC